MPKIESKSENNNIMVPAGLGHSAENVREGNLALVILTAIILLGSAIYLIYRIYKKEKYFSKPWIKEFGAQAENIVGFRPGKKQRSAELS